MARGLVWKLLAVIGVTGLAIYLAYPPEQKINLGLDLKGGMHLLLRVDTSKLSPEAAKDARDRAVEVVRNRIDEFGVKEPLISPQGTDRILVQLPGIEDRDRALSLIGRTALLEFKLVSDDAEALKAALAGSVPAGMELSTNGNESLLLEREAVLTGEALSTARVDFDRSHFGEPIVALQFNGKGAKQFSQITAENVGRRLAIVLDGKVQSAPVIRERIPSGNAVISGRFTEQEAADLSIVLRVGALPAPIIIEEERTVGPNLGRDSIRDGVRATLIGTAVVFLFMAVYYLYSGLIADVALCLNLVLLLGVMAALGTSLTLPGIAGIALTAGMAVDANVLINERIREELKIGKTLRAAITAGYDKAFITILDSNLTTLITGIILFWAGTGPVRGFAVTLSIGLVISMFTSVFVTRVLVDLLTQGRGLQKFPMLKLVGETKFDFIRIRKFAYILSTLVIVVGMGAFILRGNKNFGVDFSGGSLVELRFQSPPAVETLRTSLKKIGLGNASIQEIGGKNEVLIRTYGGTVDPILAEFKASMSGNPFQVIRREMVGPAVGKDLAWKALWALIVSMAGICAYVAWRFELKYAVAGIVALFHDVFVAMGAMALTGREISLPILAALLTIAGYSINDTIVIFDRIRENLKITRKLDFKAIVNLSVNQTLSRTILTSGTVLLVLLILFFMGGEVMNDFAFCFLVGAISGVYSTVYVASPIVIDWPTRVRR